MIRIPPFRVFRVFRGFPRSACLAQVPAFAVTTINPEAEYPACAVIDVNNDGKLDIVSGGFWYEAPEWKKHFLREVEVIRGRFDDYSNLELDVNADGWTDIVSVNYRSRVAVLDRASRREDQSQSRNALDQAPDRHARPDGNRPAATTSTATASSTSSPTAPTSPPGTSWCRDRGARTASSQPRVRQARPADGNRRPRRRLRRYQRRRPRRHRRPPAAGSKPPKTAAPAAGSGIPTGNCTRDASIPILVHDVDADGDNDLIWGRGHRYGLYWLENTNPKRAATGSAAATGPATPSTPAGPSPTACSWPISTATSSPSSSPASGTWGTKAKTPANTTCSCAYAYTFDRKTAEPGHRQRNHLRATAPASASIPRRPTSTAMAISISSPPIAAACRAA